MSLSDTEADMSIPLPHDPDTWGKTPEPIRRVNVIATVFYIGVGAVCIALAIYFH